MKLYQKIHEGEYTGPLNFHVGKKGDEVDITLVYPPWTDADNDRDQCRYVVVNQEATRASDGLRLHYDYARDGFVVEQPEPYLTATASDSYEYNERWHEVGFFPSWQFMKWENGNPPAEEYARADAEFAAKTEQKKA